MEFTGVDSDDLLTRTLSQQMADTFNEVLREACAVAWEEGWQAAWSPLSPAGRDHGPNPHRD